MFVSQGDVVDPAWSVIELGNKLMYAPAVSCPIISKIKFVAQFYPLTRAV